MIMASRTVYLGFKLYVSKSRSELGLEAVLGLRDI